MSLKKYEPIENVVLEISCFQMWIKKYKNCHGINDPFDKLEESLLDIWQQQWQQ